MQLIITLKTLAINHIKKFDIGGKSMKKRILSLFAAFAVMLSLSACQPKDTGQDTQTREAVESVCTVSETVQAVEKTAPESSEELQIETEFEIIDWTMEDLVSNIEIYGDKLSLPCTISEISSDYKVENINYFEDMQMTAGTLYKKDKEIGLVYFNGDVIDNALNSEIKFLFLGGAYDLPEFNIMGITDKSTRSDVINILGNPNMRVGESDRHFQYGFSQNKFAIIDFNKENPDELCLFFIIYNVEE